MSLVSLHSIQIARQPQRQQSTSQHTDQFSLGPSKCISSMTTNQTKMTEQSYSFRGIFINKNYSTRLNYMAPTAQDAWDLCAKLNPTFLVQNWGFEGQVD